ncbi:sugar ABC transporter ATP-binding protein [Demequina sediminicola]|uniref:sugar ABC transporter ATP-binding protein n=1 Tax=Demequina sediminicola TaxID=1095026 RepID=UPI0007858434|nr:sugar ABC transporter ATP-binding protein [Demequina sediminicola]
MRQITKEFPGVKALDRVDLTVDAGEIHAICGENGAGKSTLMKVLSGVYPHGTYSGDIVLDGEVVEFKDLKASEHAGIVIIHQELALIPELSVMENIFLGNEVVSHGLIDWDRARSLTLELLAQVGLSVDPRVPIKNLGVGQQQLIEIAKALSKDVKLLILDEPTSALNEHDSHNLLELLRGLKAKGMTSIMISHKLNEIEAIADSVTIIRDGLTIERLAKTNGDLDEDCIIRGMVGRALDARYPPRDVKVGEVLFEVEDWTVEDANIPGRMLAKSSSFRVRAGEIVGFAGVMGAGRTELARSVFGRSFGTYRSGTTRLHGKEVKMTTVDSAIKHGLAYVPEDRKTLGLNLLDSIRTTIVSADLDRITPHVLLDEDMEYEAAESFRKSMRIKTPHVNRGVATLSGGNQQKVVLSKWMFTEPELLILDEPTRGIDVGAKYEIYGLINQMAAAGKAVVLISSELPELLGMCDRIYTVCEGRITGDVPRSEADQEMLMRLMTTTTSAA